ncbi:histidine-rich glycoprotein-like [Mizuhopecten yessoensis]|uniref:histidine-rich glycoprotein-like n=1 Tax=Mizuhopecten yessoensis TaxID=6573 RepID=UPI000B45C65F|nr:histidine-rich glycoprotein-like [Mizuhopecten yessoensis]
MKLFGTVALVALLLIIPNDGRRLQQRRITAIVDEVAELKAQVEKLSEQVHKLEEQSHGVHIHLGNDHHDHHDDHDTGYHADHDGHDDHDTEHHADHDEHGDDHSINTHADHDDNVDDSQSTHTKDSDSTNIADDSDSTNTGDDNHDNHHQNEHHHKHRHNTHHHSEHHDNHYPNAHNIYVNMKLEEGHGHCEKHSEAVHQEHEVHAHCEIMPNMQTPDLTYKIRGHIELTQKPHEDEVSVHYNLRNLKPSVSHAIHVHESGDMERCCDSLGDHYNPTNKQHGIAGSTDRFIKTSIPAMVLRDQD